MNNEQIADGKVWTDEEVESAEKTLGTKMINPFGTNDEKLFEKSLASMTNLDMQKLAYRVGVNPHLPIPALKASLLRQFRIQISPQPRSERPKTIQYDVNKAPDKLQRYLKS